jgi:16S rRNA (guanine966-N2)-methyltransferase
MTRIIGGLIGSRKLASPAKSTRPTSDRIRESIFGSLDSKAAIANSSVLDLYAGTGALGLEAISRGATSALLVESNKQAAGVCIKNARLVQDAMLTEGQEVSAKVQILPVQKFLESASGKFDLVFIDPPYELGDAELTQNLLALRPLLSDRAWVLIERSARGAAVNPEQYQVAENKNYGDTAIYWLRPS